MWDSAFPVEEEDTTRNISDTYDISTSSSFKEIMVYLDGNRKYTFYPPNYYMICSTITHFFCYSCVTAIFILIYLAVTR